MRKRKPTILWFVLAVCAPLLVASPSAAGSTTPKRVEKRGYAAKSDGGGVYRNVNVVKTKTVDATGAVTVTVDVSEWEYFPDIYQLEVGHGTGTFTPDKALTAATLNANMYGIECFCGGKPPPAHDYSLHITWSGTGTLYKSYDAGTNTTTWERSATDTYRGTTQSGGSLVRSKTLT